jgi:hypothetical protein
MRLTVGGRTLVYVQGEAKMNTFENAEGKNITSLNVVQRK